MQTVWKVLVEVVDAPTAVELPGNAQVVRVEAVAPQWVAVWARISDVDANRQDRFWTVRGTGMEVPAGWVYVGSAAPDRYGLVWHVWEVHDRG